MRKEHMNIKKEGKQIRHIGQRFGRKHVIALSFFMPLIVMTGCCIAFGIQPFGDNSLLIIDGLHQYMPFYSVLYDSESCSLTSKWYLGYLTPTGANK